LPRCRNIVNCLIGSATGHEPHPAWRFMSMPDGPLFFVHIPKTGGTSLTNLLQRRLAGRQVFTGPNHVLSEVHMRDLVAADLPVGALIHGHPEWGACRPFRGKARFITLLREPRQQLVSHFLHVLRDPAVPQHAAAKALGLTGYLRTYPYNIPFQTNALYLAITDPAEELRQAVRDPDYGSAFHLDRYFARQLQPVFAFLEEMRVVGTLEDKASFLAGLAELMGWETALELPHDNSAEAAQLGCMQDMLAELDVLESEPSLAPLFAIERACYAKARALSLRVARSERFKVHESATGEIVLGGNFVQAQPGFCWTGDGQVSRLEVKTGQASACQLRLRADILHGVTPTEVMLRADAGWLSLDIETDCDGGTVFSTRIDAAPGQTVELQLYLQWNRYPDGPPFYPAIRFTGFELTGFEPRMMPG
jgi:hypothetical protein